MKFFEYIPLFGALLNFLLSLFVLSNDRRSRLNQVFFAWGICITIWNLGTYALFIAPYREEAALYAKYMLFGVIFIPVTLLHLSLSLTGTRIGRWLPALYLFHAALAVLNVGDLFIVGVRNVGYAYYSIAGPGFYLYSVTLIIQSFTSILLLWQKRKSLPPRQRTRFNGILAGQTLIVIFGMNDILPILGLDTYPFTHAHVLPYGSLAAAAYGIMVAYSVLHYQLLDVHLALGRASANIVRFLLLIIIAIILELLVAVLAPTGKISNYAFASNTIVLIITTLIASIFFPKLLHDSSDKLERRILGDHFEYQDKMHAFIEQSRWITTLDEIHEKLHHLLVHTLRLRSYHIILLDQTNRAFTLTKSHPEQPKEQLPDLRSDSPIFQCLLSGKNPYLTLNPRFTSRENTPLHTQARADLHAFPADLAFPLSVDEQPIGLLLLGEKTSGDPFTRTDTQLFAKLTDNLSLIINQTSLKNQLLIAQELDLLGKMSRGMAHDLNNLTTPIYTLLQLMAHGNDTDNERAELAPVSFRNMKVLRAYITEALFFSEHLHPDFQPELLDLLVQDVADLAKKNRRKGKAIHYHIHTPGETPIHMDKVLISRLLGNLISNAIDASSEGGTIRIELLRLAKTDPQIDWLRIRVTDEGTGIKTEDLNRILQPYFTTKKTGDENRGFGLGLAICRKIANLHSGNLTVHSTPGKGTTVNLDLPNQQKNIPSTPSDSEIMRIVKSNMRSS